MSGVDETSKQSRKIMTCVLSSLRRTNIWRAGTVSFSISKVRAQPLGEFTVC